jgi:hypothetical protein
MNGPAGQLMSAVPRDMTYSLCLSSRRVLPPHDAGVSRLDFWVNRSSDSVKWPRGDLRRSSKLHGGSRTQIFAAGSKPPTRIRLTTDTVEAAPRKLFLSRCASRRLILGYRRSFGPGPLLPCVPSPDVMGHRQEGMERPARDRG